MRRKRRITSFLKRAGPGIVLLAVILTARQGWAVDPNENQEQKAHQAKVKKSEQIEQQRRWFVDTLFSTHWLVIRDNYPRNDVYHFLYVRGSYDIPKIMRVALRLDLTRKYVADPGESGFLFGDMRLYLSRGFKFKVRGHDFGGRGYFYWTFPTSKVSDQQGNISRPTLLVALSTALPHGFDFYVRPFVRRNWHRYSTTEGGAVNPRWLLGYDINLNYTVPIHTPLSFGGSFGQYWFDHYETNEGISQPWRSYLWWEIYAGYSILKKPLALDTYLALSSGHDTIRDGVWRVYWLHRDMTEMYLSVRARY